MVIGNILGTILVGSIFVFQYMFIKWIKKEIKKCEIKPKKKKRK